MGTQEIELFLIFRQEGRQRVVKCQVVQGCTVVLHEELAFLREKQQKKYLLTMTSPVANGNVTAGVELEQYQILEQCGFMTSEREGGRKE